MGMGHEKHVGHDGDPHLARWRLRSVTASTDSRHLGALPVRLVSTTQKPTFRASQQTAVRVVVLAGGDANESLRTPAFSLAEWHRGRLNLCVVGSSRYCGGPRSGRLAASGPRSIGLPVRSSHRPTATKRRIGPRDHPGHPASPAARLGVAGRICDAHPHSGHRSPGPTRPPPLDDRHIRCAPSGGDSPPVSGSRALGLRAHGLGGTHLRPVGDRQPFSLPTERPRNEATPQNYNNNG